MFRTVTDLMLHKQLKFEPGKISIFGRPSFLIPSDSFVNLQKKIEEINMEDWIYQAGKEAGVAWFSEMNKSYNLKGRDVITWGSNIVTLAGWGEAIIEKREDANKLILFELRNSVVSDLYGASKFPVDHLFRGLLCGAMSFIYKTDLEAVEFKCKSLGDPTCKILVKPLGDFDKSNEFVKKQIINLKK
jgi:predicted hydrocarbon binding protein